MIYCRKLHSLGHIFVEDNMDLAVTTDVVGPKSSEFGEIMQNNDHYAVRGHSRSPILVPVESPYTAYATSYVLIIVTYLLSCTDIWQFPPSTWECLSSTPRLISKFRIAKFVFKKSRNYKQCKSISSTI